MVVFLVIVATVGTTGYASSHQWTQRLWKELIVPNTQRIVAHIWRKIDQTKPQSSVLHTPEVAYTRAVIIL